MTAIRSHAPTPYIYAENIRGRLIHSVTVGGASGRRAVWVTSAVRVSPLDWAARRVAQVGRVAPRLRRQVPEPCWARNSASGGGSGHERPHTGAGRRRRPTWQRV